MDYTWDFQIVIDNLPVLLRGLKVTLQLFVIAALVGVPIGLMVGVARLSPKRRITLPAVAFIEVFRNTPVLIQLIWIYYAFPVLLGVRFTPFFAAALALSLYTAAYCAEIFRAGLQSVVRGQWEGAKALGMSRARALRRIILPQACQRMLPALTNRMIELVKVTSLASTLAVTEVMYQGRLLSSSYYRPLEILTVVALLYFCLIWPFSFLAARLERRLALR